nr:diglucosylglycerate octanoyltransferase [Nocardia cyriacigeorgica]
MSSEEPLRQVPDELFRKISAKPERALPDALFGPPPTPPPAAPETVHAAAGTDAVPEPPTEPPDAGDQSVNSGAEQAESDAIAAAVEGSAESSEMSGGDAPVADGSSEDALADDELVVDAAGSGTGSLVVDGTDGTESTPGDGVSPVATQLGSGAQAAESTDAETSVETGASSTVGRSESATEGIRTEPTAASSGVAADHSADAEVSAGVETVAGAATATTVESAPVGASTDSVARSGEAAESSESVSVDAVAAQNESIVDDAPATPSKGALTVDAAEHAVDASQENPRPVLLVIADSLAYFGPEGGLPADHPRIWPNLVGAELDWDVELVARIGWTCRDGYWALIGDPRVWAAVPRAGAVVFAVGGMDSLPSPLPTALRELIRYVRPPAVRRGVRSTYQWLQPKLSKLGRRVALPPKVSVNYLEQSREALAQLRPDLPVVAVLPSVHNCEAYGRVHRGRDRAVRALRAWSDRTSVPLVDLGEAVRDNVFSDAANPDGIHWGWDGHTAVANAMVKTLQEVR